MNHKEMAKMFAGFLNVIGVDKEPLAGVRVKAEKITGGEFSRLLDVEARLRRWINASASAARFEKFFVLVMQGLGRLDCQLIDADGRFCSLPDADQGSTRVVDELQNAFTLSYLWVLGAYEAVRTLDERATGKLIVTGEQSLKSLKRDYERLRVPLAKMTTARRFPSDSPIAYPAWHRDYGISWQVGMTTFISRRELSDKLLDFLDALPKYLRKS